MPGWEFDIRLESMSPPSFFLNPDTQQLSCRRDLKTGAGMTSNAPDGMTAESVGIVPDVASVHKLLH